MSAGADLYAVLGVARDASMAEIKKSYRQLARTLHPDVVGADAAKAQRFRLVASAYEVLGDPVARGSYDRRFQKRTPGRMAGGFRPWDARAPDRNSGDTGRDSGREPSLDDLFNQDFGYGGKRPRTTQAKRASAQQSGSPRWQQGGASTRGQDPMQGSSPYGSAPAGSSAPNRGSYNQPGAHAPGADISRVVDVPTDVLERGGTVTLHYKRLRRTDDGRGLYEYDEIHDLRVPPGTVHGSTLRARGWGNAGMGAIHGDLVCDVRAVGQPTPRGPAPGLKMSEEVVVEMSVSTALLGGRIEVPTPQGAVKLTVPPCTNSGAVFRLKGRGHRAASGVAGDVKVRLKVVVPAVLDQESIALIERFRELND